MRGLHVRAAVIGSTLLWAATVQADGDAVRGKRLYLQCAACHSTGAEQAGKIGPPLRGVVGRDAAALTGFPYSDALKRSRLRWTDEQLDHWLTAPSQLVPGTSMVFAGIAAPRDRADVIAYLRSL